MKKVITYGTYDLIHYGHIRLLERAKKLGDYLVVGVTADVFDFTRGKINVQQTLSERIEGVRATGLADEIIIEEYEGQKIDDIQKYGIDIFTVGSDWEGKFDYLNEYCEVVYLSRTEGISSTEIRQERRALKLGLVGVERYMNKVAAESKYVNGIELSGICAESLENINEEVKALSLVTDDYDQLLEASDAVYIHAHPSVHYEMSKKALLLGKHVLCESPVAMSVEQCEELYALAKEKNCVFVDALRTAYATAYYRLLLLIKSGKIGQVVSVDATCTSLSNLDTMSDLEIQKSWNSIAAWGPTTLLPVFQILGIDYDSCQIVTRPFRNSKQTDTFTKISFIYPGAVASIKVGIGIKSEGELIISGTKGYAYVPAPWWKTEYFEIRYENPADNKRFFFQLDGEGIRYELASFAKSVENRNTVVHISEDVSKEICHIMDMFYRNENTILIS